MRNQLHIDRLTPAIGAEISGIDLAKPLTRQDRAAIDAALCDHLVLFFRDQPLDIEQLSAFGRQFGDPHTHPNEPDLPGFPGVMAIHTDASSTIYAGRLFHSDVSCDKVPPMGSILHLYEVPETGGDTIFASMTAAYDALSDSMKQTLAGLTARHDSAHNFGDYFGYDLATSRDGEYPSNVHPVVTTHPETGKKALFVNELFTRRIVELEPEESHGLLSFLWRHIREPRFQCRFRWRRHSVAFWDNRVTQHMALWDYYPHTRSGRRFTIAGTPTH
jgi:taurine dioxygenase